MMSMTNVPKFLVTRVIKFMTCRIYLSVLSVARPVCPPSTPLPPAYSLNHSDVG